MKNYLIFVQMSLQDLPEVPTMVPFSEEHEDSLDLPDVPSKAPVSEKAQDASVGVSAGRKGHSLQEISLSPQFSYKYSHYICIYYIYLLFTEKCWSFPLFPCFMTAMEEPLPAWREKHMLLVISFTIYNLPRLDPLYDIGIAVSWSSFEIVNTPLWWPASSFAVPFDFSFSFYNLFRLFSWKCIHLVQSRHSVCICKELILFYMLYFIILYMQHKERVGVNCV